MRLRALRFCLVLLFLSPVGAQEPSTVRFRTASLLRDSSPSAPAGNFSLPPGGQSLALQPTNSTPYDRYFGSVREVISALDPERTTMATACHLMKIGFSFQYVSRDLYRPDPPRLTKAQRAGDCKSKALWLFDSLADPDALFVIGKVEKNLRTSHAWVYWRHDGRWWILDCTERTDPIAADSVSSDRYVPYYSFGKRGSYRHPATQANPPTGRSAVVTEVAGTPDRKKAR